MRGTFLIGPKFERGFTNSFLTGLSFLVCMLLLFGHSFLRFKDSSSPQSRSSQFHAGEAPLGLQAIVQWDWMVALLQRGSIGASIGLTFVFVRGGIYTIQLA